jgi:hypothetical protein
VHGRIRDSCRAGDQQQAKRKRAPGARILIGEWISHVPTQADALHGWFRMQARAIGLTAVVAAVGAAAGEAISGKLEA